MLTILGELRSLKNSKQLICRGRRPVVVSSSAYRSWEKSAILQLKTQWQNEPISEDVAVKVVVYFGTARMLDFDNALAGVFDVLQKAGVIEDDKQIKSVDGSRLRVDRKNPRVEIELTKFSE